jgi:tetratricopeptide (TPR) repeat protein
VETHEIKKRAHELMQKGDLEGAIAEYEKLVGGEAVDPNIYNLMGDVYFKKGDRDGAFAQYEAAVEAYRKDGLYSNAIAVCRKLTRLDPAYFNAGKLMGELHLDQGFVSESAGYFLEYAEKLISRGDMREAAEILKGVIGTTPGAVKVREQLAAVYLNLGLMDEARSELIAAGEIYEQKGDIDKAAGLKAQAREMAGAAHETVGEVSVEGGGTDRVEIVHKRIGLAHHVPIKVDEVLRSFREEVKRAIGEEDYQSHYDLGMAYIDMGLFDEALAEFGVARKQPELRLRAIEMVGRCFMERDDVDLAIEELKAGLEIEGYSGTEYLGLQYNLAMAYEKSGEIEEAVRNYQGICRTDPTFRDARIRLAELGRKQ